MECIACGANRFQDLGRLGNRDWYRCICCGFELAEAADPNSETIPFEDDYQEPEDDDEELLNEMAYWRSLVLDDNDMSDVI